MPPKKAKEKKPPVLNVKGKKGSRKRTRKPSTLTRSGLSLNSSTASKGSSKKGAKKKKAPPSKKRKSSELSHPLPDFSPETIAEALHEIDAESPIDLTPGTLKRIKMAPIQWTFYDTAPKSIKLYNTAYSVVLTATWANEVPYIAGGPFMFEYEFSQIHFHWGANDDEGSEHTVEGLRYPFEMHSVFYKKTAETFEEAKKEEDGILIFAYLFKLSKDENPKFKVVSDKVPEVAMAYSSAFIDPPVPVSMIAHPVPDDYILYMGGMPYRTTHGVLWVVSRETFGISKAQLENFRTLKDRYENPMNKTFREVQNFKGRNMFLINPTHFHGAEPKVLHPFLMRTPSSTSSKGKRSKTSKAGKKGKKKGKEKKKKGSKLSAGGGPKKKSGDQKRKASSMKPKKGSDKKKK